MTRKKLLSLASVLLLLAVGLLLKSFRSGDGQESGSSNPVESAPGKSNEGTGRISSGRDPITSKLAVTRPPEPFESSKEVAALLGNGGGSDAEVIPRLMEFTQNSEKPLAARQEAMTHLLNLCSGADSESTLLELASRPLLGKELRTQMLADSLNHSAAFRGEFLMFLLENPQLGCGTEAVDGLRELTGEDFGNSAAEWRAALKRLASKGP